MGDKIKIYYVPSVWSTKDEPIDMDAIYKEAMEAFRERLGGKRTPGLYLTEGNAKAVVERNKTHFPNHKYYVFEIDFGLSLDEND